MLVLDRFDGDVELYFKKTEHDGNEVHRELSECEPPTGCPYLGLTVGSSSEARDPTFGRLQVGTTNIAAWTGFKNVEPMRAPVFSSSIVSSPATYCKVRCP